MYLEVEVQAFEEDEGAGGVQIEPRQSARLVARTSRFVQIVTLTTPNPVPTECQKSQLKVLFHVLP